MFVSTCVCVCTCVHSCTPCIPVSLLMAAFCHSGHEAQRCSDTKFIHEEHNNQTVEMRWEMGIVGERWWAAACPWSLCVSVVKTQMDTLIQNQVTDSYGLCQRFIYTAGCLGPITLGDGAAAAVTEERARVFNCDSSAGHSSARAPCCRKWRTCRLGVDDRSWIMRVWGVHMSYKSSGPFLPPVSWWIISSWAERERKAGERYCFLICEEAPPVIHQLVELSCSGGVGGGGGAQEHKCDSRRLLAHSLSMFYNELNS